LKIRVRQMSERKGDCKSEGGKETDRKREREREREKENVLRATFAS